MHEQAHLLVQDEALHNELVAHLRRLRRDSRQKEERAAGSRVRAVDRLRRVRQGESTQSLAARSRPRARPPPPPLRCRAGEAASGALLCPYIQVRLHVEPLEPAVLGEPAVRGDVGDCEGTKRLDQVLRLGRNQHPRQPIVDDPVEACALGQPDIHGGCNVSTVVDGDISHFRKF
jgi:hypothetical protein